MSQRDPRLEPAKGDVIEDRGQRIAVISTSWSTVWFSSSGGLDMTEMVTWRKWAANAEVVARGDDV